MNTGAAGGIVGFTESEVNNTKNTGAINIHFGIAGAKMRIRETNKWTKAPSIGGIVGLSYGQFAMAKCENTGKIYYRLDDPTVSANYNRTQIGGIGGGDWDAFRAEAPDAECITNYIGCVNEGNIIIDSDAAKSNSTGENCVVDCTINGAAASADNLTGTKNYKPGVHTIIATIK